MRTEAVLTYDRTTDVIYLESFRENNTCEHKLPELLSSEQQSKSNIASQNP